MLRARVLLGAGLLAWAQGDYGAAQPRLEESVAICRTLGDMRMLAIALLSLGFVAFMQGNPALERAIAVTLEETR